MGKYEEALERARKGMPMDEVFPELKESEDERIRKEIIGYLNNRVATAEETELLYFKRWIAYLEKQKEQKPVQDNEEKEYVCTLKSLIADFLRGKDEIDREYYQKIYDWLDGRHIEQKPIEWSEEDEKMIDKCIELVFFAMPANISAMKTKEQCLTWLKSFRPQPHWKPSEEQMEALEHCVNGWQDTADGVLESLYNDLQKLL